MCILSPGAQRSVLADTLADKVSMGRLWAVEAQETALAAVIDGNADPHIFEIAKLGTFGTHRNHIWRDMYRMCLQFAPKIADVVL